MSKFIVTGTGNLTKDATLKEVVFGTEKRMSVSVSVAANNSVRKQGGGFENEPVYVNVEHLFSIEAKTPGMLKKGATVSFSGVLHRQEWAGQDGSTKTRDVIKADFIEYIATAPKGESSAQAGTSANTNSAPAKKADEKVPEIDVSEDEIPF